MKSGVFFVCLIIASIQLIEVGAILKTCRPSFHEKFISGSDEIKMRWEFCTKMIFNR